MATLSNTAGNEPARLLKLAMFLRDIDLGKSAMRKRLLSAAALAAVLTVSGLVAPASAIQIRRDSQLSTVTPAMMAAIHTAVHQEMMKMMHHRRHG